MRLVLAGLMLFGCCVAQLEDIPLGSIDFYGLSGLNEKQLRSALTVRVGEKLEWPATRDKLKAELTAVAGRSFTDFTPVCCDKGGRLMFFIGFVQDSEAGFLLTRPTGQVRLTSELLKLYDEFIAALPDALRKEPGFSEDFSKGYALSQYPPLRSIQMRMRKAALSNEALLLRALASAGEDRHRIAASHLAGYANQSAAQIAALVDASRDPSETVRNNATRALVVLATVPKFASEMPAEVFLRKLNSPVWSDRNKGLMLLTSLTNDRNAKVLAQLRAKALPALIEMARWQNPAHASGAIRLLGRIAAMDESELNALAEAGEEGPVIAGVEEALAAK